MNEEEEATVAYWFVEQLQLARQAFKVVAVFNHRVDAEDHAKRLTTKVEPAIVNGVRSFDQLVDVLIHDRFYLFADMLEQVAKQKREAAASEFTWK